MKRTCLFCPNTENFTLEHVWPEWVSNCLDRTGRMRFWVLKRSATEKPVEKLWNAPRLNLTTRKTCKSCNTGWMSVLEQKASNLLCPMIQKGIRRSLSDDDQLLIAIWLIKTVMVFEGTNRQTREMYFSERDRNHLRVKWTPPPIVSNVWLASYRGPRVGSYVPLDLVASHPTAGQSKAHIATLAIGHLVMQMFSMRPPKGLPEGSTITFEGSDFTTAALPIWPFADTAVNWPPPFYLGDRTLDAFARRFLPPKPS
jgi:hypothetical protein